MLASTQPVFGHQSSEHFHSGSGATVQPDGQKVTVSRTTTFFLFGGNPIASGVFRCTVAFANKSTSKHKDCQHIGVMPASVTKAAVAAFPYERGFASRDCMGWGCGERRCTSVTAGVAKDNAHSVKFNGNTVEMVLNADTQTLEVCNPGGNVCRIENVVFPVVPAIYLTQNEATLISSSHVPESVAAMEEVISYNDEKTVVRTREATQDLEEKMSVRDKERASLEHTIADQNKTMIDIIAGHTDKMKAFYEHIAQQEERIDAKLQEMAAEFKDKIAERDQKIATLEQTIACHNEKMLERVVKHDEDIIAMKKSFGNQETFFTSLEIRLFNQLAEEVRFSKALAEQEAVAKQSADDVAACEAMLGRGMPGLEGSITAGKLRFEEAQGKIQELRFKLDVHLAQKAQATAMMGDGFIPLEQVIIEAKNNSAVKLEELKRELLLSMHSNVKQPLQAQLVELLQKIAQISSRIEQA